MKLLVLVCVCALAAADQQQQKSSVPTPAQLAIGLGHLYRRFLHVAAPEQLKLQDALDIKWRNGMMAGPPFRSPVKGTFDGTEMPTFSFVNSIINPGQKGLSGIGPWTKHDTSDLVLTFHHGGAIKVHMLTDSGVHKEEILGNPLDHKKEDAKFVVLIPKKTYCTFESLSEDDATFHSYMAIPAWNPAGSHGFSHKEMEIKFPDYAEMIRKVAKEGVSHDHDDHHDEDHHDDHDDDHDHRRKRRTHHRH